MHIIVVGAGPVGEYLVRLAQEGGHDVVLIESDEQRAEQCAQNYDVRVLHASIGEQGILEEAGADAADALIATTADDSINLMAMVLGAEYDIANLTSAVNSTHHKSLFQRLGVSTLVDPEILAARHLLDLVLHPGDEAVTSLAGKGHIYELELAENSPLVDHSIGQIDADEDMPKGSGIVLIERAEARLFPRADTRLAAGDNLLVFSDEPLSRDDLGVFRGPQE